ncbi:UNVERIFIED_CONTAM: hypothetical protein PYX00_000783 [Menopon gallinae]|uniref:Uncharacterized protein n=1 Tax=Menopon gallinae TaxID=328185 RepID=A0AAW2IAB4_9NEOP
MEWKKFGRLGCDLPSRRVVATHFQDNKEDVQEDHETVEARPSPSGTACVPLRPAVGVRGEPRPDVRPGPVLRWRPSPSRLKKARE